MTAGPDGKSPGVPVGWGSLRHSDADREQAISVLKSAFVQGRLTRDEFDARLVRAFASRTYAELEAVTGDIPAEPALPVPAHRPARRGRRWAAAVAAVAAALLAFFAVASPGLTPRPAAAPGASALISPPRYYVQQLAHGRAPSRWSRSLVTEVRATATGAVTATIRSPWPGAVITDIAAAGGQTFFMVCQRFTGNGGAVAGSRIYRFHVTGSGRVSGYSLVPGGVLTGVSASRLAAPADGSQVAVLETPGTAAGASPATAVLDINTRSGAHAVWHVPGAVRGRRTFSVNDLSFTADGHELAFLAYPRCPLGPCGPAGPGQEVREVTTPSRGGSLSSSRVLVRQSALMPLSSGYIDGAVISPDGSTITLLEMNGNVNNTVSVVEVAAATGRRVSVRYRVNTGNGFSFGSFSSGPSGRYLLLDVGPSTGGMVNGWIGHGRLVRLAPGNGGNVSFEVW